MTDENRLKQIRISLLEKKFRSLLTWEKPQIVKTVGPFDPFVFEAFESQRVRLINETKRTLSEFASDDLFLLYKTDPVDPDNKCAAWQDFLRDEIKELKTTKPSWISGGFGNLEYQADFDYWGKMEKFDLHESLMLSVGIEPSKFSEMEFSEKLRSLNFKPLSAPLQYLVRRHEQFDRKFPPSAYGKPRVSPSFLLDWFNEVELDVHRSFFHELQRRTERQGRANVIEKEELQTKTDRREIHKIAQLFTAMAIDGL